MHDLSIGQALTLSPMENRICLAKSSVGVQVGVNLRFRHWNEGLEQRLFYQNFLSTV